MDRRARYAPFNQIWYFDALRTWRPVGLETALLANADKRIAAERTQQRVGKAVAKWL